VFGDGLLAGDTELDQVLLLAGGELWLLAFEAACASYMDSSQRGRS
jgi:hypothetical protein